MKQIKKDSHSGKRWGLHYIFWLIVFVIFNIIISYSQILSYDMNLHILLISVFFIFFVIGHFFLFNFINTAKPLFESILNLNNYSYWQKSKKYNIPYLIFTIPVYLIIFQTYFTALGKYNFVESLVFGWIILIFVRCSHYADYRLGNRIGEVIGSFFIPFGFLIFLINLALFVKDFSLGQINVVDAFSSFLFFILFLLAYIPLEVLMDYKNTRKEENRIKTKWENSPYFIRRK